MKKRKSIVISENRIIHKISIGSIILVESKGMHSTIHSSSGAVYSCSKNLGAICKELDKAKMIFRVHTSFAINMHKIIHVKKEKQGYVLMQNGYAIPISKRRKSDFFRRYFELSPVFK